MLRDDQEERDDRQAEAEFWQEWDGKTSCLGMVAKLILLVLVVVQQLVNVG